MFGIYMKRYYLLYGLCFSASKENPIKPNHVEVEKQEKRGKQMTTTRYTDSRHKKRIERCIYTFRLFSTFILVLG